MRGAGALTGASRTSLCCSSRRLAIHPGLQSCIKVNKPRTCFEHCDMDASSSTASATAMAHSYPHDHAAQAISPVDEAAIESLVNVSPSGAYKSADVTTAITATHADEPLPQQHQQVAYADQYAYQHPVAVDGPSQQTHQSSSLGFPIDEDQKPSILQHAAQSGYPTQYATITGHTSSALPPPTPTSAGRWLATIRSAESWHPAWTSCILLDGSSTTYTRLGRTATIRKLRFHPSAYAD